MKRAKKPKDPRAKWTISPKQLDKVKAEIAEEAVTKTGMLYLAALADKGWDEDQIAELFETVSRYTRYIDDKLVRIRDVQDIIERKTGITIKGKW